MKKYILRFIINGLTVCGAGPVILAIIYAILNSAGLVSELDVSKIVTEIISVTLLAFIAGGITVIYKIERVPLIIGIMIHALVLYLDYIVIYLMNGWLKSGFVPFLVFTSCFVVGFAVIWVIIYFATKKRADRINRQLESIQAIEKKA